MSEKKLHTESQKEKVRLLSEFTENILIVDDEQRYLNSLREIMSQNGLTVELAHNGAEAINRLKTNTIGLLLLDLNMPDISGDEVMNFIKTNKINTTVIVVSGESSFEAANSALQHGAYDYVKKPYATETLINSVNNALKKRQLEQENTRMQAKLQESEKLHRYLVNKSPDIVYMLDSSGRFTFVNKRLETLLGYKKEDVLGNHYTSIIHEDDHEKARHTFNERRTGDRSITNVELRFKCKNNDCAPRHFETSIIPIEISAVGIYNTHNDLSDSKFLGTYGIARDITERVEAEEIIRFQAYHDMLTRLPNRTLLKDRLNQAISHARRNESKLSVMFLDLDRFKMVNDTLGHLVGDQLLQAVSVRLKKCLREGDTLARIGGDEFTLLLPEIHDSKCSELVAHKIIKSLEQPFCINDNEFFVSTSIGIAHYPDDGTTMETLIKHADIAMYSVKGNGKNGYKFYADNMNEAFSEHLSLENDMRRALTQKQFKISYQPQINIETGEVFAMEALILWDHPERGSNSPSGFISRAEEAGLILPIGEWVLRNACAELKRWREAGLSNIRVAINISACQLEQENIVKTIIDILHENNIPGEMLEIEITENMIMKDIENGISKLTQLSNHGINIAIDDFGTGYSSMAYLKHFPIDVLKVDRSFVKDLPENEQDATITKAIISLPKSLDLGVVAEGVETQPQLQFLRDCQCDQIQGYLFSPPIPPEKAGKLLGHTFDEGEG